MIQNTEWYNKQIKQCQKELSNARYPEFLRERIAEYNKLKQKAIGQQEELK